MCQSTDMFKRGHSTLSISTRSSTRSSDADDLLTLVDTSTSSLFSEEPKKRVRFGAMSIVQFDVRIGDSIPSYGPPIGLGEEVVRDDVWCVNHYEYLRPARKTLKELKLDPWKRTRLLYRQGYNPETIEQAAREADTIRANRKESTLDNEQPVQERPGLIQKGSKKFFRLTHRLRLPHISRFNFLNTRA